MKTRCLAILALLLGSPLSRGQDIDKELVSLADKLAVPIKEHGTKKITVLDFTDLHGSESELGKYIAEQLTVDFVLVKRDFAVLDRANLAKILAEHKLTAKGLVDPENAKKLGQFAGVDALVLGTIIPKGQTVNLTAKVITTDTAEVVGAARSDFNIDATVKDLFSQKTDSKTGGGYSDEGSNVVKTFDSLRVELSPLEILGGKEYVLTMTLSNASPTTSVRTTLNHDSSATIQSVIRDSNGTEFKTDWSRVSGFALNAAQYRDILIEVKPRSAIVTILRFESAQQKVATPGRCKLRMELIITTDQDPHPAQLPIHIIKTELEAK